MTDDEEKMAETWADGWSDRINTKWHDIKDTYMQAFMHGYKAKLNDRCPCGGTILADTEDLRVPLCCECAIATVKAYK